MTAERKTCPVTRDRLHPGLLITGCGGEVLETATKCPLCGKQVEFDPFKRLEDEYDALEALYMNLNRRWAELVTEVHRLRDFKEAVENRAGTLHVMPDATMKRIEKTLERRKREVQALQEACRKHRQARRAYWWKLYYLRGQLYTRGRTIASQRRLIERYEGRAFLRIKETYPAPSGTRISRFECSACGAPFEWTDIALPTYCPNCPQKFRLSNTPTRTPDEYKNGDES